MSFIQILFLFAFLAVQAVLGFCETIRPEKPKKVTYVDGSFISFDYNSYGAVTSATDELGNTQSLTTDLSGLLTARKDALGNETKYDYNPRGDLIQVTDPAGSITTFEVDLMGRRTKVTGANGEVTKYEYDSLGRLFKITDANNRSTVRGYRDDGGEPKGVMMVFVILT